MTTPVGKGRPTPKRSEAQGRRGGPVLPPPATRKEAARRAKEQAIAARAQVKQGAARGDAQHMMARDAGPVRALVRDVVDARRSVGVLLLPLAGLLIVARLTGVRAVENVVLLIWLSVLLAMVADVIISSTLIRRRIRQDFPAEGRTGRHIGYGLLRSTVLRRFRVPPPRVTPGRLTTR